MTREIKYIGMDVYQEAIVIAVLNGSGKIAEQNPLTWICSHRPIPNVCFDTDLSISIQSDVSDLRHLLYGKRATRERFSLLAHFGA